MVLTLTGGLQMEYYSLNKFLKDKFGSKVAKLSLDAGFCCPNRDGTLSNDGCIFCSPKGSGDFSGSRKVSITEQINQQKDLLKKKWTNPLYIAYFQDFTNTYSSVDVLKSIYFEAINQKDICGIAIATRPDCLSHDILKLLKEVSEKTYLWVELGLQSSNEITAKFINRGYDNRVYEEAVNNLTFLNIDVVTHVILGLPNETKEDMLNTIRYVVKQNVQGIKIQLLHVLKNTELGRIYEEKPFHLLTMEEYADLVCECLEIIPNHVVIHRITGDGSKKDLIGPLWSSDKKKVLNYLNKKISENKFV